MAQTQQKEGWNSRLGIILAVAGSAVGLGNFLRFPGQAAEYGGGAFMVAYFISFIIVGLPICWAEWTLGRYAGQHGFNTSPGILNAIWKHPCAKYLGVIGVVIPIIIYMYYVNIEAWCLGYAVNFITGSLDVETIEGSKAFTVNFTGMDENGGSFNNIGLESTAIFVLIAFVINFILIYRGLSKGIERFCTIAIPLLLVLAIITLIRVLTLGTPVSTDPDRNVENGLGFMWNPTKTFLEERNTEGTWIRVKELVDAQTIADVKYEIESNDDPQLRIATESIWHQLGNPSLWLAASSQIFFSLSVGFGIIMTYASYLKKSDDVVLSGLAATSTNELCEVALGGLITLPAAVAFLGVAGLAGIGLSTFSLGFIVLPMVFSKMIWGAFFGFCFFFLLFLAAVTSSISMLQPGIAFLEETLEIDRKRSVALLGLITAIGCCFVFYFSANLKALDTLDFWVGSFLIFIQATIEIIIFGWVMGINKGFKEAHKGALIKIPNFFKPIFKYVCPIFLFVIFITWVLDKVFGIPLNGESQAEYSSYIKDLFINPNEVAWASIIMVALLGISLTIIVSNVKRYREFHNNPKQEDPTS